MKSAAGTTSAPSASAPARTSARSHSARTTRKPTNGIQRKIAYVGCTTASTNPAAAVEATSPSDGQAYGLERQRERSRHEELA